MLMSRRGFLGMILAAAVAPAIVRASSLMKVVPRARYAVPEVCYWVDADGALLGPLDELVPCPLMYFSKVREDFDYIDVSTLMSEAKEYALGVHYGFRADFTVEVPPGARAEFYFDGRPAPVPVRLDFSPSAVNPTGVLVAHFDDVALAEYGNRVPVVQIRKGRT